MLHQWLSVGFSRLKLIFIVINSSQVGFLQRSGKSASENKENIQNPDNHTLFILFNELFSVGKKTHHRFYFMVTSKGFWKYHVDMVSGEFLS